MSRYSYPLTQRAKLAAWRGINNVFVWARSPVNKHQILMVTGQAGQGKIAEVEARLRFLVAHLDSVPEIVQIQQFSSSAVLRSAGVVAVESAAVPEFARQRLQCVADLDFESNPLDGWALMELGAALAPQGSAARIAAGEKVFNERVGSMKAAGERPVYVFGTGPSLGLAGARDYSDGTAVACNTIVRDRELWHHIKPAFFTAGDAIYHFGHTAHARAFRADALKRLRESNGQTLFVYPAVFDVIVRSEFREVADVLVPIPWGEHTDVTVDLVRRFELPRLGNVLNALLLPLGCTLSHDVRLWGFDGRAPNDKGFWSNSNRHAYPELIDSIKGAHPAFFAELVPAGNEIQYVNDVHGDRLDGNLTDAEARGFRFWMLHPSWTPTLQKRYCP